MLKSWRIWLKMIWPWLLAGVFVQSIAASKQNGDVSAQLRDLNHGYGQLFDTASGLQHVNKILYVKFESNKVEAVIDDISEYSEVLAGQLKTLVKDYPALRIDDTGLSEMEARKRDAVNKDRIKSLAPVVGQTGKDFERTLLLTQSGALNQLRFLARVIQEEEKDENRRNFLKDVANHFDELYDRVVKLLHSEYFC